MNKKGQALVEFVMILPVILILIFLCIDFGHIYYEKTSLENTTNDALNELKTNDNTYDDVSSYLKAKDNKLGLSLKYREDGYMEVTINKKITIFTPGLNLIIGNPYNVKVTRVVKYEQ